MNIAQWDNQTDNLLLKSISGSRAYGLNTPASDTDIKGVFFMPKPDFYGLNYRDQLANGTNDIVYYEVGRFVELLAKNNPNILELLSVPDDCILYRHELMGHFKPELFLSRLCEQTFAGYAQSQIKKAKGLNKKIFNPIEVERKTVLDFCYAVEGSKTIPLNIWLVKEGYTQEDCGLIKLSHAKDMYALFHNTQLRDGYLSGICSGAEANDVRLSSVPEKLEPLCIMSFNKDGYSAYCKDYKEYWEWVEKRNDSRYQNTMTHGKNYDAKNMMHTFRLLNMAEEIAVEQKINVRRRDREFLFKIKNGEFDYDDLLAMANEKIERISELYAVSNLPDAPDEKLANDLLITIRENLYK
ncbi:MAG: nucleotidyltransferase [Sphingobacteriales bacterium]|nr:MAG: nucleotidyltransferase [Sphingobacteriales bacterium]